MYVMPPNDGVAIPPAVLYGVGSVAGYLEESVQAPVTLLRGPNGQHEVGKVVRLKFLCIYAEKYYSG